MLLPVTYGWDHTGWRRLGGNNPTQEEWNKNFKGIIIAACEQIIEYEESGMIERDLTIPGKETLIDADEKLISLFEQQDQFIASINPNKLGSRFLVRFYSPKYSSDLEDYTVLIGDNHQGKIEVENFRASYYKNFDIEGQEDMEE